MTRLRTWLLTLVVALGQSPDKEFSSPDCHIRFRHPANWGVQLDSAGRDTPCSFSLRPVDWPNRLLRADSVDLFTTRLDVYSQPVWEMVSERGFERRSAGWVVLGRQGLANRADSIGTRAWAGLRGIRTIGCFREGPNDVYAGLCDASAAVVGTATRTVALEGGPQAELLINRILATLRFTP